MPLGQLDCVWRGSGSSACWAASPSGLGTHWLTSSCIPGPLQTSYYFYDNKSTGSYYNWDWLNNNLATYVYQTVEVTLHGTPFTYTDIYINHTDSGESAINISGYLVPNVSSNCIYP